MADDAVAAAGLSYAAALGAIAEWLRKPSTCGFSPAAAEHLAPHLIAHLAKHDPPILTGFPDEFKENA